MNDLAVHQAAPIAIALPTPCWWIDRDDCWEITHHPTREDAEANHADRVRDDYGWVLSVAGAFAIVAGVPRQEPLRCWEATCPECGATGHFQRRFESCVDECGYEFEIEQIPPDDPNQARIFEVLPTHDLAGQPLSRVVLFTEEDPR
ncbi:hypothetical protein DMC63_37865 [Streptomyces sp. WAC 05977]|nr:hypothetical protein DMC63_37865 [Streptomyces sp. WAC 05977]